jgi:hypothetical protein
MMLECWAADPQHLIDPNHSICLELMWEPFNVGLGQQPIHHDIISSEATTREFQKLPEILANKCGGRVAQWWTNCPST